KKILSDTRFVIRTTLNRSAIQDFLTHTYKFPGIIFSESAFVSAARFYADGSSSQAAEKFFDKALRDYPGNTRLMLYFFDYSMNTGYDREKAAGLAGELRRSGKIAGADKLRLQAISHAFQDNLPAALNVYGPSVIGKYSADAAALNDYARFWTGRNENLQSALEAAQVSVRLFNNHFFRYTLGCLYWKLQRPDEAEAELEKAVKLSQGSIILYKDRLAALRRESKMDF
ncbi:tetratricopeptide repeat protein, partial [candidate division KSB1 bacterium]